MDYFLPSFHHVLGPISLWIDLISCLISLMHIWIPCDPSSNWHCGTQNSISVEDGCALGDFVCQLACDMRKTFGVSRFHQQWSESRWLETPRFHLHHAKLPLLVILIDMQLFCSDGDQTPRAIIPRHSLLMSCSHLTKKYKNFKNYKPLRALTNMRVSKEGKRKSNISYSAWKYLFPLLCCDSEKWNRWVNKAALCLCRDKLIASEHITSKRCNKKAFILMKVVELQTRWQCWIKFNHAWWW